MTERKSSINTQSSLVLAGATTDGAGAITTPLRQQGVNLQAGTTNGWRFLTDGTDGVLICTVEGAAGLNGFVVAKAQGTGALLTQSSYISETEISVTVLAVDGTTPVDLAATAVAVQAIAATL